MNKEAKLTIAIVAKAHDAHVGEESISLKRDLGFLLAEIESSLGAAIVTHFSPTLLYLKETLLTKKTPFISLSPACSFEEHESIFRYKSMPGEAVLYTGLGSYLTLLTLLRSSTLVICLDEDALFDMKAMSSGSVSPEIALLNKDTLASIGRDFSKAR